MTKNYIVRKNRCCLSYFMMFMVLLWISSCKLKPKENHHNLGKIEIDSNLKALASSTNGRILATAPTVKVDDEVKILILDVQAVVDFDRNGEQQISSRVAGRIEKLYVKYNYQSVKKGQLLMEIYAPELAAAQQELLFLAKQGEEKLLAKAKERLKLWGLSTATIEQVLKTKKINYRIPIYSNVNGFVVEKEQGVSAVSKQTETGDLGMDEMTSSNSSSVSKKEEKPLSMLREGQYVEVGQTLFTVYNSEKLIAEIAVKPDVAQLINTKEKVLLYANYDKENLLTKGFISKIEPQQRNGENYSVARVYLEHTKFKVGDILIAKIPVLSAKSYWLPQSAVVNLGHQNIVFKKSNDFFETHIVKIGIQHQDFVQILSDIPNWEVAKNAAYLVDSEGFIKTN